MPIELPELYNICQSGALAYGKWGHCFENRLRNFLKVDNLLVTSSYGVAMQIALLVLKLKPGDEVIASPMCCLASSQPLVTYGLTVKWADIDPRSGTLDPDSVKKVITPKTKAIVHNHFCGYIGYVDEINSVGKFHGIPVIDDCIEAFGSSYKSKYSGNLGADISVFSFQTVRLPNTIDGGAIAFKEKSMFENALLARDLGIDRNIFRDSDGEISNLCDISDLGCAGTLNELSSYIGCCQMDYISDLLLQQRKNADKWHNQLAAFKDIYPLDRGREIVIPNYWVFGLLCNNKIKTMHKFREHGYYASSVHLPNTYYSVFGKQEKLLGVNEFYNSFLAIPCGWWM